MTEVRGTASQRRAQAIEAGFRAFADHGLTTTAIHQVAAEMGVSQPYVFRLFGSKKAFFLACVDELEARVRTTFNDAARDAPEESIESMGAGFRTLVADGVISGLWLQACAVARNDEAVAARCRLLISRVLREAEQHTRTGPDELAAFLGRGALVVLFQALGVDLSAGSRAAVDTLRTEGSEH
jgi:AcrR family transcriptional regulator